MTKSPQVKWENFFNYQSYCILQNYCAEIDEATSSNATAVAADLQVPEAGPEEQELAANDDADGAAISAIDAVATAQENNRARLENMLEEVDSMFEEVSGLMVDVTDLMRRANELREEAETFTPPPRAERTEEEQEAEQSPAANASSSAASVHSRHSDSNMSLDNPAVEIGEQQEVDQAPADIGSPSGSDMSLDSPGSEGESRNNQLLYIHSDYT